MSEELKIRLEQHKMWLLDNSKGKRFECSLNENLRSANLRSANLSSANLRSANLRSANLSSANLSSANLRSANLSSAVLSYANLSYASLPGGKTGISILGMRYSIVISHDAVFWGCKRMTFEEVKNFKFSDCKSVWDENEFKLNKKIITETLRYYRGGDR